MLCPYDCSACRDADCTPGFCRLTGEPMLDVCHGCGEIRGGGHGRIQACVVCADDKRAARTRPLAGVRPLH